GVLFSLWRRARGMQRTCKTWVRRACEWLDPAFGLSRAPRLCASVRRVPSWLNKSFSLPVQNDAQYTLERTSCEFPISTRVRRADALASLAVLLVLRRNFTI